MATIQDLRRKGKEIPITRMYPYGPAPTHPAVEIYLGVQACGDPMTGKVIGSWIVPKVYETEKLWDHREDQGEVYQTFDNYASALAAFKERHAHLEKMQDKAAVVHSGEQK